MKVKRCWRSVVCSVRMLGLCQAARVTVWSTPKRRIFKEKENYVRGICISIQKKYTCPHKYLYIRAYNSFIIVAKNYKQIFLGSEMHKQKLM